MHSGIYLSHATALLILAFPFAMTVLPLLLDRNASDRNTPTDRRSACIAASIVGLVIAPLLLLFPWPTAVAAAAAGLSGIYAKRYRFTGLAAIAMCSCAAVLMTPFALPWHSWLPNMLYVPFGAIAEQLSHFDEPSLRQIYWLAWPTATIHPSIANSNSLITGAMLLALCAVAPKRLARIIPNRTVTITLLAGVGLLTGSAVSSWSEDTPGVVALLASSVSLWWALVLWKASKPTNDSAPEPPPQPQVNQDADRDNDHQHQDDPEAK